MHDKKSIKLLMVGDIVGVPGCAMLQKHLGKLKQKYQLDAVVVNGENAAPDGRGLTIRVMKFFKHNGVDMVTSGNHIWQKKEIYSYLQDNKDLLRPANYPGECPGVGVSFFMTESGIMVGVLNLQGRTFMREQLSCPFKAADSALLFMRTKTPIILVDFHAEASSEKVGLGLYLDGRVSVVVGTHTHVQTADARILPEGTAFITDVGMVGSLNSMIGLKKESVLPIFLTQMPSKFEVEIRGPRVLSGLVVEIDTVTGKSLSFERLFIVDSEEAPELVPEELTGK